MMGTRQIDMWGNLGSRARTADLCATCNGWMHCMNCPLSFLLSARRHYSELLLPSFQDLGKRQVKFWYTSLLLEDAWGLNSREMKCAIDFYGDCISVCDDQVSTEAVNTLYHKTEKVHSFVLQPSSVTVCFHGSTYVPLQRHTPPTIWKSYAQHPTHWRRLSELLFDLWQLQSYRTSHLP